MLTSDSNEYIFSLYKIGHLSVVDVAVAIVGIDVDVIVIFSVAVAAAVVVVSSGL